jgi:hypothetical protein
MSLITGSLTADYADETDTLITDICVIRGSVE